MAVVFAFERYTAANLMNQVLFGKLAKLMVSVFFTRILFYHYSGGNMPCLG